MTTVKTTMSQQYVPFKLSYVDFPPRCAGAGNVICSPDYERFDSLLKKANEWLKTHSNLKVKVCESVEVKGRYDGVVDTNKSCFFEADHSKRRMRNLFIRVLRLWIVQKEPTDPIEPQQIGYIRKL
ncbi:hypothetical protein HELRODRAFT_169892 [Helobdella robusta]|uniref:Uncharacterized protein n=1 Tax=Helobdella robusta TaxID=6412 RepID=T1F2E9_HELRO|nr:hypothetical protein HELRODRAFT_169892 [Helobdella robusta]ESO08152.1 hypothetical protein HELRODRAFT_169892 [Helobdella robusta]